MPTGYTSTLCDSEQSFTDFALGCARAFGACIEQRDEPISVMPKSPTKSTYAEQALIEYQGELSSLEAMSAKQQLAYGLKHKKKDLAYAKEQLAKKKIVRARILKMISDVDRWSPPSPDHEEFKQFMSSQLKGTLEHDGDTSYYQTSISELTSKDPMDFYNNSLECCRRSVERAKENVEQTNERHSDRSKWITDLFDSLLPYDNGEIAVKLLSQKD